MESKITKSMLDSSIVLAKEAKDVQTLRMASSVLLPQIGGLSISKTGECLGIASRTVSYLRNKFFELFKQSTKINTVRSDNWGGRRKSHLSTKEEKSFIQTLEEKAKNGGFVDINIIKKEFEVKIGATVHKTTIYRLLERNGWRKISPRRYHPKRDLMQQETFKKTLPQ